MTGLYLRGLKDKTSQQDLKEAFSPFGAPKVQKRMRNTYANVQYSSHDEAVGAMDNLTDLQRILDRKGLTIELEYKPDAFKGR